MRPWICRRHRNLCLHRRLLGEVDPGVSEVSVRQRRRQRRADLGSEGREDGKMAQGHRSLEYPALEDEGERLYAEQGWWDAGSDVGWNSG